MALASYTDLKSEIANWMDRTDVAGDADTFIDLGEAFLNDEFNSSPAEAALVTVGGSRLVDVSSLAVDVPIALFLDIGSRERRLSRIEGSQATRDEVSKRPQRWELDGINIAFDAPADAVYNLRFEYDALFNLSDSQTTNNLLTRHPDIYLAACLVWGGMFIRDPEVHAQYSGLLRQRLPAAKSHYIRKRKPTLKMPTGLLQRRSFNIDGNNT